jgi:hypothetical protein
VEGVAKGWTPLTFDTACFKVTPSVWVGITDVVKGPGLLRVTRSSLHQVKCGQKADGSFGAYRERGETLVARHLRCVGVPNTAVSTPPEILLGTGKVLRVVLHTSEPKGEKGPAA